jgi:hypothetical protein
MQKCKNSANKLVDEWGVDEWGVDQWIGRW